MQLFLDHLFGDLTEGRVELAWTDAGDGKLRHARTFSLDNLEVLVDEAAKQNAVVGIGPGKLDPPFGRVTE